MPVVAENGWLRHSKRVGGPITMNTRILTVARRSAYWTLTGVVCGLLLAACGPGGTVPNSNDASPTPTFSPDPDGSPTPTPSATPTPTPTPPGSQSCATDADCPDDGLFCNGEEFCDLSTQSCTATDEPCDADTEECDEEADECVAITDPGCESDADCSPTERCDQATGECVDSLLDSCIEGAGPCNIGNSSPGCENIACCEDICVTLGQVQCCLIAWDGSCADLALSQSTCLSSDD